jgi:hypothetical protein
VTSLTCQSSTVERASEGVGVESLDESVCHYVLCVSVCDLVCESVSQSVCVVSSEHCEVSPVRVQ